MQCFQPSYRLARNRRWRDLRPDQRDAFLALIADEADRLAALVGEVK